MPLKHACLPIPPSERKYLKGIAFLDRFLKIRLRSSGIGFESKNLVKKRASLESLLSYMKQIFNMKQILITFLTIILVEILLFLLFPFILVKDKYSGKANAVVINTEMKDFQKNLNYAVKLAKENKVEKIYLLNFNSISNKIVESNSAITPESIEDELNPKEINSPLIENITLKDKQLAMQAKTILKVLIRQNFKSAIVISEKFDSRRNFLTYQKLLSPVGIDVYIQWQPDKWSDLNWIFDEDGIMNVTGNFFKLLLYFAKGYI